MVKYLICLKCGKDDSIGEFTLENRNNGHLVYKCPECNGLEFEVWEA